MANKNNVSLTLIRGPAGSGKSTIGVKLSGKRGLLFEADQYFMKTGVYLFDYTQIKQAHEDCKRRTRQALELGYYDVCVANTFVKKWEMEDYFSMAKELSIPVQVIICTGNFKSIHGVPDEVIERMRNTFEY